MWVQVVLILEIATVISCIHCVYGRRVRLDFATIVLFLSIMIILEIANSFEEVGLVSFGIYVPIFIYCRKVFRDRFHRVLLKILLSVILVAIIEFICSLIVSIFIMDNVMLRNVIVSFVALFVCRFILPKLKIDTLDEEFWRKYNFLKWILLMMFSVVLMLMFQGKIIGRISIDKFVFVIPFILVVLLVMIKWNSSQKQVDHIKREVDVAKRMEDSYSELLTNVRLKQHEFKNHITAILSAHYTYKTYEKLVEVQDEYCQLLLRENKYNDLLQINNKVMVGFLYKTFSDMEDEGIDIQYKISSSLEKCSVPTYHLIEMWGILLNNAAESQKHYIEKKVWISVFEKSNRYVFEIRNRASYVALDDMTSWFQKGQSSKGKSRGLGLYHLKCLCEECNCEIGCSNLYIDKENWIVFSLEMNRDNADS